MKTTGRASIANNDPPADLVERFAGALARLRPDERSLGLAVSGGPDSMAMLLLAHAAIPDGFAVATVDHGLRPEARAECALVEQACEQRGIACTVLGVKVAEGNLQAEARKARYSALAGWAKQRDLAAIVTAHHADDQAETLLMRLNRASGVTGLAGVRETGLAATACPVIRPLLGFRRAELRQVIEATGLAVAHDPSNEDESYDRVRIRRALADADWLDPLALAKSAVNLAEAEEALEQYAARIWDSSASRNGEIITIIPQGPRAIRLRIIERAIATLGTRPRGQDVARLLDKLEAGEGGNIGGVLVTSKHGRWIFRLEPPRGMLG